MTEKQLDREGRDLIKAFEAKDEQARMYYRAVARRSLYFYFRAVVSFPFILQGKNLITPDVFKEREDFVQWGLTKAKRILVRDPRAHVKSWGCTIAPSQWIGIQRPCVGDPVYGTLDHPSEIKRAYEFLKANPHLPGPDSRLAVVSDSVKRGGKWVGTAKAIYESNRMYRWLFPETLWESPSKDPECREWSQYSLFIRGRVNTTLTDGFLRAAGLESKEQGGRAEGLFIEDIVGETSYKSSTELEKRRDYLDTITNLLENSNYQDARGGFVLVNGNDWAPGDVNAKIVEELPHYAVWSRRAYRCMVHGAGNCGREMNKTDDCAPSDVPTWLEQYPTQGALEAVRLDKGPRVWAAQWMNDPTEAGDLDAGQLVAFHMETEAKANPDTGIIEKQLMLHVRTGERGESVEVLPFSDLTRHLISIDPASSQEARAARTAIVWEALHQPTRRRVVLECIADRMGPTQAMQRALELHRRVTKMTGMTPETLIEKVAAQDYARSTLMALADKEGYRLGKVTMLPVPRGPKKEDRQSRRIGDLLDQRLLLVRAGINLIPHEIAHFPAGTKDTLDAIAQCEDIYQGLRANVRSGSMRNARARRRQDRLMNATAAGAPL